MIISRSDALLRAALLGSLRRELAARGFVEITTPVLLRSGTGPRPPKHAMDVDGVAYQLRGAIEILLRTALTHLPRVYDIGPVVRFEDGDRGPSSAVEFSLLEFYGLDFDLRGLMQTTEDLIRQVTPRTLPPIRQVSVSDWLRTKGVDFRMADASAIRGALSRAIGDVEGLSLQHMIDLLVSRDLEPCLQGFVFLVDYPVQSTHFARRRSGTPELVERFEAFIDGLEVANGYLDALDPEDVWARVAEDPSCEIKRAFVEQSTCGIPAGGGVGIGIERLLIASVGPHKDVRDFLHSYQH